MNSPETIIVQLSPEWFAARLGCVTASRIKDVMARTKGGGYAADRDKYMAELLTERLTETRGPERFVNASMQWGNEKEPEARMLYEVTYDVAVVQVGFIKHPTLAFCGASPDGLVDEDGSLEIKCPESHNHIETLLSGTIAGKYVYQMQWQMRCANRKWCDFVSYDPRLPPRMQLFCKRVQRDDTLIASVEKEVSGFLVELAQKIMALNAKFPGFAEAA